MARRSSRSKKAHGLDLASRHFDEGKAVLAQHPLFAPLAWGVTIVRDRCSRCPPDGWAVVFSSGKVHVHPTRRGSPEEWTYVLAHCLLHLGFEHFRQKETSQAWNTACDCFVARFLDDLKLGKAPQEMRGRLDFPGRDESALHRIFSEEGIPPEFSGFGTAGLKHPDMIWVPAEPTPRWRQPQDSWADRLRAGIEEAVGQAVEVAGGSRSALGRFEKKRSNAHLARGWFISSYPLLGALASAFDLIEDVQLCQRLGISVAAINLESREIFINPAASLSLEEARFVLAHEYLHAGLRHDVRQQGRDPYFWNVACDYVINGWLIEMQVGTIPNFGGLYDPELKGLSAEAIYDRIVADLRKYRKLATLAGFERCDILEPDSPAWWATAEGVCLDEFYRNCLTGGLVFHEREGRGFLPAGLIEEIRALDQPAIPWDVQLAQWFDGYFAPLEKRRTYARPSRRQASTPDIPRPRWCPVEGAEDGRTFGAIIDTSGSMDRATLGKALGAVANYAISRDIPGVRVVFCDAAAYDQGYLPPESILERVKVRGRGGTVLQPGVHLLERAEDFPKDGPILIITDGLCDSIRVRREHAFLLPVGRSLPFAPRGPVFRIK